MLSLGEWVFKAWGACLKYHLYCVIGWGGYLCTIFRCISLLRDHTKFVLPIWCPPAFGKHLHHAPYLHLRWVMEGLLSALNCVFWFKCTDMFTWDGWWKDCLVLWTVCFGLNVLICSFYMVYFCNQWPSKLKLIHFRITNPLCNLYLDSDPLLT